MRGDRNKRLTILSAAEKLALYGLPSFDDFQRVEFFALGRKSLLAQMYCLLQIGVLQGVVARIGR